MKVNRLADLQEYEASGHFDMKGFRLQGFDASDAENFWTGLSYFLPGGGTTHTATPLEKVYVGIEGNLTIVTDDDETISASAIPSGLSEVSSPRRCASHMSATVPQGTPGRV